MGIRYVRVRRASPGRTYGASVSLCVPCLGKLHPSCGHVARSRAPLRPWPSWRKGGCFSGIR
eukprot:9486851-Pyramimonas_sp.AAC.1